VETNQSPQDLFSIYQFNVISCVIAVHQVGWVLTALSTQLRRSSYKWYVSLHTNTKKSH